MPARDDVCLLVMNCREIPSCLLAFRNLDIDQVWLRGYQECELGRVVDDYVRRTGYGHYILASDDLMPTPAALKIVLENLGDEPFTGWCNLSPANLRANVRLSFPSISPAYFALTHRYSALKALFEPVKLRTFPSVEQLPGGRFQVFSTNFAFTAMSRDTWLRFPLSCGPSGGSDFLLTRRLVREGVPIWCHRDAFFYHIDSMENFIVGKVRPQVMEVGRKDDPVELEGIVEPKGIMAEIMAKETRPRSQTR